MNSLVVMVAWLIWKERDNRVFEDKYSSVDCLLDLIKRTTLDWFRAGVKCLESLSI